MSKEKLDAKQIKQSLLNMIKNKKLTRKELIKECVKNFKFTKEELKDNSSDSKLTKTKSIIGSVVSQMLISKEIDYNENKKVILVEEIQDIELKDRLKDFIINSIKSYDNINKKILFKKCEEKFGKNKTTRSLAGILLSDLVKSKIIDKNNGVYKLHIESKYPSTDVGNCFRKVDAGEDLYENFINIINLKGGEFFEQFSVKLIEKLLSQNNKILSSKVTGGPKDNGIDGVIEVIDKLGFKEIIKFQAKTRARLSITVKEVREFNGALIAEKGTRGIYITTTSFHSEAKKYLNKFPNIIGIDNKRIFDLAKELNYGITKENKLDQKIFLENEI